MEYISLALRGPLASFGYSSKTTFRGTADFPTKSSVFGMILASQGKKGTAEELDELNKEVEVIAYDFKPSATSYLYDFQIFGSEYEGVCDWFKEHMQPTNFKGENTKQNAIANKTYLQDVKFGVILSVKSSSLAKSIASSLNAPVWPIFFGRKCCIPTMKVYQGTFSSHEEALGKLKEVFDSDPKTIFSEKKFEDYDESKFINDVPIRFIDSQGNKFPEHSSRKIYIKQFEVKHLKD